MIATTDSLSIEKLEQQIATISAEIEKVKAQKLIAAQKSLTAAERKAAATQQKISLLKTKGAATPAAEARLKTTTALLEEDLQAVSSAKLVIDLLVAEQKAATKIAKKVAKKLSRSNHGKKSKAQKKADKKAKKSAKKIAKAEKHEKPQAPIVAEIITTSIVPVVKAVRKTPVKPSKTKAAITPPTENTASEISVPATVTSYLERTKSNQPIESVESVKAAHSINIEHEFLDRSGDA